MKGPGLSLILSCWATASFAQTDFRCQNTAGTHRYQIDVPARTIIVNDAHSFRFDIPFQPHAALFGFITAYVDAPKHAALPRTTPFFILDFNTPGGTVLIDVFSWNVTEPLMSLENGLLGHRNAAIIRCEETG